METSEPCPVRRALPISKITIRRTGGIASVTGCGVSHGGLKASSTETTQVGRTHNSSYFCNGQRSSFFILFSSLLSWLIMSNDQLSIQHKAGSPHGIVSTKGSVLMLFILTNSQDGEDGKGSAAGMSLCNLSSWLGSGSSAQQGEYKNIR